MFKVNISNASQNLSWSASFETEQLAQDWLAQQIGKPHRLPEREVSIEDEYAQEDVIEVIQSEVIIGYENGDPILDEENNPVLDEQGNPTYIQVPITELQDTHVRLKAQFTSEIVDISAQVAQQETNRAAKAFLEGSDYKVLRHIRQKALQQATTLTEEQYLALEQQRSDAAASIVE
jgi:hypothetical protein